MRLLSARARLVSSRRRARRVRYVQGRSVAARSRAQRMNDVTGAVLGSRIGKPGNLRVLGRSMIKQC